MNYVYIDGDDIGLRIENCLMTNNETGLQAVNREVNAIVTRLTTYLKSQNFQIIFSGADGIIFKAEDPRIDKIQSFMAEMETTIAFSIGVGNSLREAFLALRYAKSKGKNGVATLDGDFNWVTNPNKRKMAEQSAEPDCENIGGAIAVNFSGAAG